MLVISGVLILMNRRCLGAMMLLVAMIGVMVVKDNPWMRHNSMKTTQKEIREKFNDFVKNLSLVGSAFFLMLHRS